VDDGNGGPHIVHPENEGLLFAPNGFGKVSLSYGWSNEVILVRPVYSEDLYALLRLYRQLVEDQTSALPADPIEAASLLESITAQPGRQLLVAEAAHKVVGTADLLIVPNLTHGGAPWAMVENLVVDGESRGQGVGRAIVDELIRRCELAGCYKIQLLSHKRRVDAHEFYRSVGFEAVAEGFRRYLA
jgi:GNAT superfamily N-acetyltransferase